MTAMTRAMHPHTGHCSAAACSCARISMIMDAAITLAVSIFVVVLSLRLWLPA